MTIGRQGKKVMKNGENKAGVVARQGPLAKAEDVIDATPIDSGTFWYEVKSAYNLSGVKGSQERVPTRSGCGFQ